jgi:alkyl sulfatase BDS1-like metallo-beta-lactamase superfamily hydrolase
MAFNEAQDFAHDTCGLITTLREAQVKTADGNALAQVFANVQTLDAFFNIVTA